MSGAGATRAGLVPVLAATAALPWALGGTPLWAYRPAAFLIVTGFAVACWRGGAAAAGIRRENRWLWPALALGIAALVQAAPLPEPIVRAISPRAAEAWGRSIQSSTELEEGALARVPEAAAHPLPGPGQFEFSAPVAKPRDWPAISYHPAATRERLAWFLALGAAFLVAFRAAHSPRGRRLIRGILLADFALLGAAALFFRAVIPGQVLGVVEPLRGGNPYGPYVNPTHLAFVMEMAVPWFTALAWQAKRESRSFLSREVALPAIGAVLCAAAAFGSASKAAAVIVPGCVSLVLLASLRRSRNRLALAAAVGIALTAAVLALTPVRARLLDFVASGSLGVGGTDRGLIWRHAAELVTSHPVLGTGFGAFRHVIPRVLPAGEAQAWLQLHNDYLEVVVDGGAVGAALLALMIWGFWSRSISAIRSATADRPERIGILIGVAAVTFHASFDFGHQMPGNALLFVVTAAMAVAVPGPEEHVPRRATTFLRIAVSALVALSLPYAAQGVVAGSGFMTGTRAAALGNFESAIAPLDRGAVGIQGFDSLWWGGDVRLGAWDRLATGEASSVEGSSLLSGAAERFLSAEREVAASGWTLQGLGSTYRRVDRAEASGRPFDLSWIGGSPWAAVGRHGRIAVGLHRMAVEREPTVSDHRDALIVSLLDLGLRAEAAQALRHAARLQPNLVQHQGLDPDALDDEMVEAFYEGAKEAIGAVPMMHPQRHLLALGQTAYRLRRYDEAREWLEQAVEAPAERIARAEARAWMAFTAERQGRHEESREWFRSTVEVPNFREASLEGIARLSKTLGDLEGELRARDRLRREFPDEEAYLLGFADVAVRADRASLAVEALRSASRRRPDDPDLTAALAEALLASGNRGDARRAIDRLEARSPADPRLPGLRRRLDEGESGPAGRP